MEHPLEKGAPFGKGVGEPFFRKVSPRILFDRAAQLWYNTSQYGGGCDSGESIMENNFDLIIRGGTVFDGSGADGSAADVAIAGDRVAAVGDLSAANAATTIEAAGCVVCPGFIDIHSHAGIMPLLCPTSDSKVLDGVTTEIDGNCGLSPFPQTPEMIRKRRDNSTHGIVQDWSSFDDFAARLEDAGSSVNRAFLVGHGKLRACVAGQADRDLSPEEHNEMARQLRQCLDAGAFGLSSGLIYPPGCFSTQDEMVRLCRIAREYDAIYATHIRSEGDGLEAAIGECCDVAAESGVRLQISHLKAAGEGNWHKIDWLLDELRRRLDAGVDLAVDRYPYVAASTTLDALLPTRVAAGGLEAKLRRLSDPDVRSKIAEGFTDPDCWRQVVICSVDTDANKHCEGMTLAAIAEERACGPTEAMFDLILEEQAKVSVVIFSMCEANLEQILQFPLTAIGSDASVRATTGPTSTGKPHPRAYGPFARTLGVYVRERGTLDLATAIYRMTGLAAQRLRLAGRGVLRPGSFADITVFDPETITDKATFAEPHRYSSGIMHVFVNGAHTVAGGRHTGALAGRLLRRG